ncbi:cupin domain-containing protein [Colletotrichum navitas]|uniref:Cupin domain-containing protein n=1 Tax=Colletotrichum navitas TaxID=681940 RepID=A0AAD8QEQ9_9PEZI|nr:cupin domain-containing protein [Colletotrichum navitas]KAK1600641.1 cupin domain-containing protein [Colletotrichum navitas]
MASSVTPNNLRRPQRFITDHAADGKAVFNTALPEEIPQQTIANDAKFYLGYTTEHTPVSFAGNKDVETYAARLANPPGIVIPGGSVMRIVDCPPNSLSPMHRTVSLDYGVVLEGEVDLVLDSGETRRMRRGDVSVQRGTMHAWKNVSETQWARMLYVLQESQPLEVAGQVLEEDYGVGMEDVKPSSK